MRRMVGGVELKSELKVNTKRRTILAVLYVFMREPWAVKLEKKFFFSFVDSPKRLKGLQTVRHNQGISHSGNPEIDGSRFMRADSQQNSKCSSLSDIEIYS